MTCKNCKTQFAAIDALYCPDCGSDFCPACARTFSTCGCYGELRRYS